MELKEQRYVCTLAASGSLLSSANQLNISSSALSLYISNLEERLGTKLFDRIGKQFVLTYAGSVYVEAATKMLELKEDFDAAMSSISKNTLGRVRVGMQKYRSPYVSPEMIMRFNKMHPSVEIKLFEHSYNDIEARLKKGELDIFFCNIPSRKEEFDYHLIMQDLLVLVACENHPAITRTHPMSGSAYPWVDIHSFKDERMLLSMPYMSTRMFSDLLCTENNFKPANVVEIEKTDTILQMVSLGYGVTLMPAKYCYYPRFKTPPKMYSVGRQPVTLEFSAVYRKGRELPPYMLDLINIVKDIIVPGKTPELIPQTF